MIDKQLVTPSLEPKGFTGRAVAELICLTGWNAEARQWHGWHEWKKINTERGKQWKALLLLRTHLQMGLHPRNDLRGILPDEKGYAVTHYIFFLYKKEICYILLWILLIFFLSFAVLSPQIIGSQEEQEDNDWNVIFMGKPVIWNVLVEELI